MQGRNKKLNKVNKYVREYAKRHNITVKEALKQEIVQNVIKWMNLREQENKQQ